MSIKIVCLLASLLVIQFVEITRRKSNIFCSINSKRNTERCSFYYWFII